MSYLHSRLLLCFVTIFMVSNLTPVSYLQMSDKEAATRDYNNAQRNFDEANARLNDYMNGNYTLPPGITVEDIKAAVKDCLVNLESARQSFNRYLPNTGNFV